MITTDPNPAVPWKGWSWCRVCGVRVMEREHTWPDNYRCLDHKLRNPCAIEDCKRSTKAPLQETHPGCFVRVFALDQWICAEHWRLGCPPRSPERRIYLRFFRRARKFGWNDASTAAFWRIWSRIVAVARARASGDVDMGEISRLMGWDKAA